MNKVIHSDVRRLIIVLLTVLTIAGTALGEGMEQLAPDFTLPDTNGLSIKLSGLKGQLVLLVFGSTPCPHCAAKVPLLNELDDNVLKVAFVLSGDTALDAKRYIEDKKITFDVLLDRDHSVAKEYMVTRVPEVFLIDSEGLIVYSGPRDGDSIWQSLPGKLVSQSRDISVEAKSTSRETIYVPELAIVNENSDYSTLAEVNTVGIAETPYASTCCTPPSCPSGYSDLGVSCTLNGLTWECTRTCYSAAHCGSYGNSTLAHAEYAVYQADKDKYFYSPIVWESPDYCYRYSAVTALSVSDWDPGGILHLAADSYNLHAQTSWEHSWGCRTQDYSEMYSAWHTKGRGESGTGYMAAGKFIPYTDTSCGSGAWGLEGWLSVNMEYERATWFPEDYVYKTCSVSIACNLDSHCGTDGYVGTPFCSSNDLYQNYRRYHCYNPGECDAYCSHTDTQQKIQECGDDSCESWGSWYCYSSTQRKRDRTCHDRGCSGYACFDNAYIDSQTENCPYGCSSGQCKPAPPLPPSDFKHSSLTTTSITWTWKDNSIDEDGFRGHDSSHNVVWTVLANVTSHTESGLSPNTMYTRHAHAYNTGGDSAPSNSDSVYTLAQIPGSASFSNVTTNSIQANWTANGNSPGTRYYCEDTTKGTNSGWTTNTYWNESGLGSGVEYCYRVKAKNGNDIPTGWTDLGCESTAEIPAPEISVRQDEIDIPDDRGNYDFDTVILGSSRKVLFTIENLGNATLQLTGPPVLIQGPDADDFEITRQPIPNIIAGGSDEFEVTFTPNAKGLRQAYVYISNNDSNENPYNFAITGKASTTIYVDDDYTTATPGWGHDHFAKIQDGIDAARDGIEVIVARGAYSENIDFTNKNILLRGTDPCDLDIVADTVIDGSLNSRATVTFSGGEYSDCVLSGFKITGGRGNYLQWRPGSWSYCGGGVCVNANASPTIKRNIIVQNTADCGGAIFSGNSSHARISNSIICDNEAGLKGGAVLLYSSSPILCNNTIVRNNSASGATIVCEESSFPIILNNIIAFNNGVSAVACADARDNPIIAYNDFWANEGGDFGGAADIGNPACVGNIYLDPLFVDPTNNDFHLRSEGWRWNGNEWIYDRDTSRCIDAGNPGSSLGDELLTVLPVDPNNDYGQNLRIDMGVYGGTHEASMPPCDWAILSDLTNNGIVDFVDFAIGARDQSPIGIPSPADLDRNGVVDMLDVALFAQDWLLKTNWYEP